MAETKDISDEEKKKQEEEKKKEEEDKKELSNGTETENADETETDTPTIDERVIAMEDKVTALSEQMATIIDTINENAGEGEQLSEKLADKTEEEKKKEDKKELSDKTDDKVELSKRIDSMEKMLVKLSKTGTSKLNQSGGNKDPDDVIIENAGKKFGF